MSMNASESALVAEYEWLRQLAIVLESQANYVDKRLVEIELTLPDAYRLPADVVARREMGDDADERYVPDERR